MFNVFVLKAEAFGPFDVANFSDPPRENNLSPSTELAILV